MSEKSEKAAPLSDAEQAFTERQRAIDFAPGGIARKPLEGAGRCRGHAAQVRQGRAR